MGARSRLRVGEARAVGGGWPWSSARSPPGRGRELRGDHQNCLRALARSQKIPLFAGTAVGQENFRQHFPSIPADDRLRREFCAIPTVFLVENSLERAFRRI